MGRDITHACQKALIGKGVLANWRSDCIFQDQSFFSECPQSTTFFMLHSALFGDIITVIGKYITLYNIDNHRQRFKH